VTFLQAMVLAVLQGFSELFPISSLGHTVLLPALLGWHIDRTDPTFLAFVVALHLGTACALLVFYRRDWARIAAAFIRSVARGRTSDDPDERLGRLLIAGTIPLALVGVFLEEPVKRLFGSATLVAGFLILNACVMFLGERLKRVERVAEVRLAALPYRSGVAIGFSQALALLPGISRSGSSIVAGLLAGLDHEDSARFSFLLATPAIGAASLLEIPRLFAPAAHGVLIESLVGGVVAACTAFASVAFLTRYFRSNDLRPFGWYCLIFGALCLTLALTKVIS
jgi:undecaprenyl-diphosphatase